MSPEKQKFVLKRGVVGTGLPVAMLTSLMVAFQRPGSLVQFQSFNVRTFMIGLGVFVPIFVVAGYVWGFWLYGITHKR